MVDLAPLQMVLDFISSTPLGQLVIATAALSAIFSAISIVLYRVHYGRSIFDDSDHM